MFTESGSKLRRGMYVSGLSGAPLPPPAQTGFQNSNILIEFIVPDIMKFMYARWWGLKTLMERPICVVTIGRSTKSWRMEWHCPVIINQRVIGTLRNGNVVFLRGYE